jgi:putative transposase
MTFHSRLPHLRPFARQPIIFLTVVTHERRPLLATACVHEVLREIWLRSPTHDGWSVGYYVLMPDHVHLFARAHRDAKPLSAWVGTWKSLSARRLAPTLGSPAPFWQRDYFDRFLRSADDYSEKWDYVAANPVRAGLCPEPASWPWRGHCADLSF